jgi:hypothetical protein
MKYWEDTLHSADCLPQTAQVWLTARCRKITKTVLEIPKEVFW